MKVVINACIGGYSLSKEAIQFMAYKGQKESIDELRSEFFYGYAYQIKRNDEFLVMAVETLGEDANGSNAKLKIVEIPDGVDFVIFNDGTGLEWIAEKHKTWS
jgi:hypothetical protein